MNAKKQPTPIETLSACLLRLGRMARVVPVPDFLGQAVGLLREVVPFRRGWWGMGTYEDKDRLGSIYQVEYLDLPADFHTAWREIASADDFAASLSNNLGRAIRFRLEDEAPPEVLAFEEKYQLHQGMGLMLDEPSTGHRFFIVVYRDRDEPPFDSGEAVLFQHIVRHTVQHWRHAMQDALSSASKRGIDAAAIAGRDGRVIYAGSRLCDLLRTEWQEWDGVKLPADVVSRFDALPCSLRLAEGTIDISERDQHIWLVRAGAEDNNPLALLSPRERRVAHLYADGHSYKEIARLASLTPATVRTYLRAAYLHLGVRNKVQLGDKLGRPSPR